MPTEFLRKDQVFMSLYDGEELLWQGICRRGYLPEQFTTTPLMKITTNIYVAIEMGWVEVDPNCWKKNKWGMWEKINAVAD